MSVKKLQFRFLISCLMSVLSVNHLMAQFKLSAEYRPRTEYRHGYKSMFTDDDKAAFFISQRLRLNAGYSIDKLKLGFSVQDIRVWGDVPQQNATSNQLMLFQGWAEYLFTNQFSMKIGRQELNYDDARIFGNVDWAQQARVHDLILFKFEKNFKLHFGAAFNQESEKTKGTDYNVSGNYKTMQFIWFNKKINSLSLSLLFLNNGFQNKSTDAIPVYKTAFNQTYGTRLVFDKNAISLYGASYYTTGEDNMLRDLSAYYATLGLNYKVCDNWETGLGWELLSGTSQEEKKANVNYTNKSFNPFYGTNHKFNGYMDYFYVGNHLNSVGLNDFYCNITYKKNKFNTVLTPHLFSAANDVLNPTVPGAIMPKSLGTEIDLVAGYKLAENILVSGGYSQMFGTETLKALSGGDNEVTNNWGWLMITFNPELIK
jgi:hypothetical protein